MFCCSLFVVQLKASTFMNYLTTAVLKGVNRHLVVFQLNPFTHRTETYDSLGGFSRSCFIAI
jgi:hypothetical protein